MESKEVFKDSGKLCQDFDKFAEEVGTDHVIMVSVDSQASHAVTIFSTGDDKRLMIQALRQAIETIEQECEDWGDEEEDEWD